METAVLELPKVETRNNQFVAQKAVEKIILRNVSWETYERLVQDQMNKPGVRLTYDNGDLQIMVESIKHGKLAGILGEIISEIADLLDLDFISARSTTFRKEAGRKGFEPDDCFYFGSAQAMRRVDDVDLSIHPAPELIVEVDVTSPSLPRFPIFADVGVSEVWRYDGTSVKFYRLRENNYVEVSESVCLPSVTSETVEKLLEARLDMTRRDWLKFARETIEQA